MKPTEGNYEKAEFILDTAGISKMFYSILREKIAQALAETRAEAAKEMLDELIVRVICDRSTDGDAILSFGRTDAKCFDVNLMAECGLAEEIKSAFEKLKQSVQGEGK